MAVSVMAACVEPAAWMRANSRSRVWPDMNTVAAAGDGGEQKWAAEQDHDAFGGKVESVGAAGTRRLGSGEGRAGGVEAAGEGDGDHERADGGAGLASPSRWAPSDNAC